jgi:hypothetical protein
MKHLLTLLAALAILAAPVAAQTIKSLGFNTTNGEVIANTGTNVLTFGAPLSLSGNGVSVAFQVTDENFNTGNDGNVGDVGFGGGSIWLKYGTNQIDWGQVVALGESGYAGLRTNLGLPLNALTNTSNVTMMRALAGSTNTNAPFSGSVSVVGTNNTNTLVFTNGILLEVTTP